MRLTIQHETHYRYEDAPGAIIEVLRLTPRSSATQTVLDWRIDVTGDATLRRSEDAFGNITHIFRLATPSDTVSIVTTGTVETETTDGILAGTREAQPRGVFLRQTPLTHAEEAVRALVAEARSQSDGAPLDRAHALNRLVNRSLRYEAGTTCVATPAGKALAAGSGVCQDLTHVLLAAARADGLPARYVSGYQFVPERPRHEHESHAWAEIFIDGLGWVGFDPTAGLCVTDAYVRVAVGLDYLSASPVRGAIYGGGGESLAVDVVVDRAVWHGSTARQAQSQTTQ